jgi:hypothetical protein
MARGRSSGAERLEEAGTTATTTTTRWEGGSSNGRDHAATLAMGLSLPPLPRVGAGGAPMCNQTLDDT